MVLDAPDAEFFILDAFNGPVVEVAVRQRDVRLTNATPATAVRAAMESAGAHDFTVGVAGDGRTIYVRPGAFHATFGNYRVRDPARESGR